MGGLRGQEVELQRELLAASRNAQVHLSGDDVSRRNEDAVAEEELVAEDCWREARELGAELGEARAPLLRRRAERQNGMGDGVIAALRAALEEAMVREQETSAELAEVHGRVVACLGERHSLQTQVGSLPVPDYSAAAAVQPHRAQQQPQALAAAEPSHAWNHQQKAWPSQADERHSLFPAAAGAQAQPQIDRSTHLWTSSAAAATGGRSLQTSRSSNVRGLM